MQRGRGGRGRGGRNEENSRKSREDMSQEGRTKLVPCKNRYFVAIDDPETAEFADYQEIKVQETFRTLKPGLIPRSICVIL